MVIEYGDNNNSYYTKIPECPYCYNGSIVRDPNAPETFFCNGCFREIKIPMFNGNVGKIYKYKK